MSNAPGYDRGYRDYKRDKPCLVSKNARGKLVWRQLEDDAGWAELEPSPEQWAEGYIAGYTQACKDDDGYDVPMNPKERLRG
jgi:hypothetical protein